MLIDLTDVCLMIILDTRHETREEDEPITKQSHFQRMTEKSDFTDGLFHSGGSPPLSGRCLHCASVYTLRSETFKRRHVDGSFTSDVSKVLDSLAAKEYILWVMTSKPMER